MKKTKNALIVFGFMCVALVSTIQAADSSKIRENIILGTTLHVLTAEPSEKNPSWYTVTDTFVLNQSAVSAVEIVSTINPAKALVTMVVTLKTDAHFIPTGEITWILKSGQEHSKIGLSAKSATQDGNNKSKISFLENCVDILQDFEPAKNESIILDIYANDGSKISLEIPGTFLALIQQCKNGK